MTLSSQNQTNYPSSEEALYFLEDIMGRSMVPFFLLGDCARAVKDNQDQIINQPIEVGILKKHYTEFAKSILPMFLPSDTLYTDSHIKFTQAGTPVTVKIISRRYKVLDRVDHVFYRITNFSIPNPFEEYWKIRSIVR